MRRRVSSHARCWRLTANKNFSASPSVLQNKHASCIIAITRAMEYFVNVSTTEDWRFCLSGHSEKKEQSDKNNKKFQHVQSMHQPSHNESTFHLWVKLEITLSDTQLKDIMSAKMNETQCSPFVFMIIVCSGSIKSSAWQMKSKCAYTANWNKAHMIISTQNFSQHKFSSHFCQNPVSNVHSQTQIHSYTWYLTHISQSLLFQGQSRVVKLQIYKLLNKVTLFGWDTMNLISTVRWHYTL